MHRCLFGRSSREAEEDITDINEKAVWTPRDWSAISLTAIRLLQFAYFAFVHASLRSFERSSYFREDGPWHHSPDGMRHSTRMMRWARMQASINLIYHAAVLVVPWLLRLVRATRRPYAGFAAVFGDGCAMLALLNTLAMLDTAHEDYCHGPPPRDDFDLRAMFGKGSRHHDMSGHRSVCHSLDVVFGLGSLVILSHVLSAAVTALRAKRPTPTVHAKVEAASDVEQAIPRPPAHVETSVPTTPRRQHSPPPPYLPVVAGLVQGHASYPDRSEPITAPRGRSSVETTSSLGFENYLVSDGWRAPEVPPEYSSRPPSLHQVLP
ncbi:hypothetical protein N657DRAFT_254245 [Parathielavia appendiculata]|uniref:Uncharacterized protein n=1 Tax=Parathielavia appendiculata TaxID=2587402 RepID=A0AAN6TRW9_9PEZI|nr:hypothetical protein N657DRAFT_254245 [Parathielavia appendiculata]